MEDGNGTGTSLDQINDTGFHHLTLPVPMFGTTDTENRKDEPSQPNANDCVWIVSNQSHNDRELSLLR